MVYHKDFGVDVNTALANAFQTLGNFGLPIIPMLQAYGGVNPADITSGAKISFETHYARGVTIFRLGTMGANEFAAVRAIVTPPIPVDAASAPLPDPDPTLGGQAALTRSGQPGYSDAAYEPLPPDRDWRTFNDVHGWQVKYKPTSLSQDVYANYRPSLRAAGRYTVEVFIPHQNAEARSALYFVIYYLNGARIEQKISLDQSLYFNQWASLGVFDLDPAKPDSGQVNQVDFSQETPPRSIVFSAVRWRPFVAEASAPPQPPPAFVDGCDAPIGTEAERRTGKIWPGEWNDATGYARWYGDSAGNGAYHTGADLNLNKPRFNLDRGAPIYAMAAGVVTWAAQWGNVWRNIVIVEHDPLPDGTRAYSRYAHVENIIVGVGDQVRRGQQIASVGMSGGPGANYHLHFDISLTDILKKKPGHWPGANRNEVLQHYVDPRTFIAKYRPK
jgi:murein DD-endopeptidase MepM/ murein hydrolase activator NlpD